MASPHEKSKPPSTISPPLQELRRKSHPLFLDRNQGNKIMPAALRDAGLHVVAHSEHFPHNEPDHLWIPACAAQGWIIVTADQRIETDPLNRQAVIDSRARILLLSENQHRAIAWAAAIIVSQRHIYERILSVDGPCVLPLKLTGNLTGPLRTLQP
jgi:hypothetical protein